MITSKQKYYYVLVSKRLVNGEARMIVTDGKLPIYWNRKSAKEEAEKYNARVERIAGINIDNLIQPF